MKTQSMQESEDRLEAHLKTIAPPKEGEQEPMTSAPQTGPVLNEQPPQEEPPVETPPAPPAEEPPAETPPQEGASVFDVKTFNERFGSEFADEDTLKSSLSRLNDLQEFDTLKAEREELQGKITELQAKYQEAQELLDPRKHFVSEEEYKRQLILQQHGQELNPALLNRIVTANIDELGDVEVLTLGKLVANPNILGGETGAREMIYQQLGVDPDENPADWNQLTKNLVAEAANNVRKELRKVKDIDVPEKADFEAQRAEREQQAAQTQEQLKNSWSEVATEMVSGFNTLDLSRETEDGKREVYFSYEVDDKFKQEATDLVVGYLVDNGMEPSKENVREAEHYVQDLFWRKNGNAIVQAYGRDVEAKLIEKHNLEIDNPKPPSDQEAPAEGIDQQNAELIEYVKEGLGRSRQPGESLFK